MDERRREVLEEQLRAFAELERMEPYLETLTQATAGSRRRVYATS